MVEIDISNFDSAYDILESSFIPFELKTRDILRKQWYEGKVSIFGIEHDETLAGVITLWSFPDFVFAENFAVEENFRNKGIGAKLLNEIIEKYEDMRIILEVEPPESEIQKRRIKFYERNGFTLSPFGYIQPPLRKNAKKVPLMIMHTGETISEEYFNNIKSEVFSTVYNYNQKQG